MEIHLEPDGKITMTENTLQNHFECRGGRLLTELPLHSPKLAYPEQKLRKNDIDSSQDCNAFGDDDESNEEKRSFIDEDFGSETHRYIPIADNNEPIQVESMDDQTNEECAGITPSPLRKPVASFPNSNTDDGTSSPATATTSSLSAVSSFASLPHRVSRGKCFKLQLPFKVGRKKEIIEDDGMELEVNGGMVESGFDSKVHCKLSPVSCGSVSSTDASIGVSESLKPASGGKSFKCFSFGMWKKCRVFGSHPDYGPTRDRSTIPTEAEIREICSKLSPQFLKRAEDCSSHSGYSAETEIWNNLTQHYSGPEKYRMEDFETSDANSLCEGVAMIELEYSDDPDAQSLFGLSEVNAAVNTENQTEFQTISDGHEVELLYRTAATEDDHIKLADQAFVRGDKSIGFEQQLLPNGMDPSSDVIKIEDEEERINGLGFDCSSEKVMDYYIEVADKEDKDVLTKSPTRMSYESWSASEEDAYISSSTSEDSSRSSSSEFSFCSQGILKPPRRAKSNYDPFGIHSDFTLPRPRRRVHFSNIDELYQDGAFYEVMQNQRLDDSSNSSASTSSLIFLAQYIGCPGIDGDDVFSSSSC